jgi:hypothetical protein
MDKITKAYLNIVYEQVNDSEEPTEHAILITLPHCETNSEDPESYDFFDLNGDVHTISQDEYDEFCEFENDLQDECEVLSDGDYEDATYAFLVDDLNKKKRSNLLYFLNYVLPIETTVAQFITEDDINTIYDEKLDEFIRDYAETIEI